MTSTPLASGDEFEGILDRWRSNRPPSTADVIVELLREAIIRGDLPAGMPLRQERIAQKFGISKIPLREALAKLDASGFVTTHPRRGVFVSDISLKRIDEIFQLRLQLETDVMRHAVPRLTPQDLAAAEEIIEKFDQASTHALGKLNWEFHHTLYNPSGRELTLQILNNLHLHVDRYVRLHMGILDPHKRSNDEHRAIVAACRKNNAERAVSILHDHINSIRIVIRDFVGSEKPSPASK